MIYMRFGGVYDLREFSRMSNSFPARDSHSFRHRREKEREKVDRVQE